ncbi:hypothetical protein AQUCO_04100143v1 [Aquilegia coerulea]|uniref:CRAL-TRIO domain-containing protein n=1 Tax=Aquilegia coerulea TaxID=218851 RepID=A0A2G5CQD2_AQUCA|nr:hypothetical protein AQUCO_04100143v1 [Aquilegia coerulea]
MSTGSSSSNTNGMEKTQQTLLLTEMRKLVAKQGSSAEHYGDPILMRFLIARSMDPTKAAKMFIKWKKWREEIAPLGYIPQSEILDQLEAKKVHLQGFSTSGHPVLILKMNRHIAPKDQLQTKKGLVHSFDKAIASSFKEGRETGNEKFISIMDLDKISYNNLDTRGIIAGFKILQDYYPEHLAKLYFLSLPGFFVTIWKMISRALDKTLLDKIVIVKNEDEHMNFIREIGEETLPEEYGGRAKLVAIQDVIINHFQQ